MLALVSAQIVLGSWLRHYRNAGRRSSRHAVLAVGGLGHAACFWRAGRAAAGRAGRAGSVGAGARAVAATLQVVLGIVRVALLCCRLTERPGRCRSIRPWSDRHQTNGALLLAAAVVLTLRCFRHLAGRGASAPDRPETRSGRGGSSRPRWTGRPSLEIAGIDRSAPAGRVASPRPSWPRSAAALAAYLSLTKPRLVLLVLVTVAVGFLLGARGQSHPVTLVTLAATLLGTALVAGGAGASNQWLERDRDARMRRTANRAFPAGRSPPAEAAVFGGLLVLRGHGVLLLGANVLAAAVALVTFVLYVFVYTPLKPRTTLNTVVGAIPGALPPLIGWAAATGRLGIEAWALVPDRVPLAVPPLPGDRLDLSRRLPPRRLPDADRRATPAAG